MLRGAFVVFYECWPTEHTRSTRQQRLLTALDISGVKITAKQASSQKFPLEFITELAGAVIDGDTGELLEYCHLMKRPKYKEERGCSFANEIGRLCQGMPGRSEGTDTMFFIHKEEALNERCEDMTKGCIVCNVRPQKKEINRTRLTVDGSRTIFEGDCSTPTANLLTVKLLFNSIVSTPGTKFWGLDLKDFYLNTLMERPEYLRMKLAHFPDDVIDHYKLREKVDKKMTYS